MTRILIWTMFLFSFSSCENSATVQDEVKFDSNADTLQVIRKYSTGKIKEIVYYRRNQIHANIGYFENGFPMFYPRFVFSKADSSFFAFLPVSKQIDSAEIYLAKGEDTTALTNEYRLFARTLEANFGKFNNSKTIKYNYLINKNDSIIAGVLRCYLRNDKRGSVFYPFTFNIFTGANEY